MQNNFVTDASFIDIPGVSSAYEMAGLCCDFRGDREQPQQWWISV